jgi:hypothetical protein
VSEAGAAVLLADVSCFGRNYFLNLRLLGQGSCSVRCGPDGDGAIELSPENEQVRVPQVVVESPSDDFCWLRPASAYPHILNGQY